MFSVFAHHLMHDGCRAGEWSDRDVDRVLRLQPTRELMMVNDGQDISVADVVGQLSRVIGIHNHARLFIFNVLDHLGQIKTPPFGNELRLGIRITPQYGL